MAMEDHTLWIDFEHFKCYKIPNTLELSEGDVKLYTLGGHAKSAHANELAAWEIPWGEIQTFALNAALQFLTRMQEEQNIQSAPADRGPAAPTSIRITPQALSDWISGLAEALEDTIASDETRLVKAQEWIRSCRLKAFEWGIESESALELWPNVIRASYLSAEHPENFQKVVEWLRTLSARTRQLQAGNLNDFLQALTELNQLAEPLFAKRETEEERKLRYQKMAREAMPQIPVPDMKEMIAQYRSQK